jgi:hypothetical protein
MANPWSRLSITMQTLASLALSVSLEYAFNLDLNYNVHLTSLSEMRDYVPRLFVHDLETGDCLMFDCLRRIRETLAYLPKFSGDQGGWESETSSLRLIDLGDGWERVTACDSGSVLEGSRPMAAV